MSGTIVAVFARGLVILACASGLVLATPAFAEAPGGDSGKVLGLSFAGRMVADLDKSVAFYKALGFRQDPAANSAWRRDELTQHVYGKGAESRMAKMFVNNEATGERFVVYLRELRGVKR